ncbi:putative siderophore biosynthesis protein SbnA [Pseudomonas fluorescens]|uniref:cysteine synthase n=1 Tax=Pseudomonas fluorescens TaxID=294 RepID=A0A5E7K1C8_PSEFL|nr:pyridoxal-phosphate dependent enzyme [Pseudomonas fluorescens]VVN41041.1 putative siderophore biosynthesis protein SbnA [Pseudomonas fluorescens]VVO93972.1 putative siderophore biosynthesis protein SbnA [Pseudomonas fluorescens]
MQNIVESIGSTPVLELRHPLVPKNKKLFLKLEQFNPNLSIKDRTALGLIQYALKAGKLLPGGRIIESTSGNLGKSLAMIGAAMGFGVTVVVDPKVSSSALNWYRAYGATVDMVTVPDQSGGYQQSRIARVKELLKADPNAYWPNQYDNPDNPDYHCETTSKEFLPYDYDVLAGCVSTGGHLSGIAKGLKSHNSSMKVLACDVKGSAVLGGNFAPYLLNGVGLAWRSSNTHIEYFDYMAIVEDKHAISMCRILARECGVLLGGSAGLVAFGALQLLYNSDVNSILAIMPDSGANYLDTLYDDNWVREKDIAIQDSAKLLKFLSATSNAEQEFMAHA